jgi:hypothetical protein
MKTNTKFLVLISVFLPMVSHAELGETIGIFDQALRIINDIIIPLVFGLALLYFFWGVAQYIRSAGSDKEEGRQIMIWGVIALFVMTSVWGLVRFIRREFKIDEDTTIKIPSINKNR